MNKIIGIDYGTKKVGVAISNEDQEMAFPVDVFPRKTILETLSGLIKENDVKKVVVGESKQFDMTDNPIMVEIKSFVKNLEEEGLDVVLENEFMSSMQASRLQGYNKKQDASAAALILQSYLDKQK